MKNISLQLRITILSSMLLTIACIILTSAINVSANKWIKAIPIVSSFNSVSDINNYESQVIQTPLVSSEQAFRLESFYYMIIIIILGTIITYFITGKALKPIKHLTTTVKHRNIDNLNEQLIVPKNRDEIYDLTLAYQEMSNNLQKSFQLQKQFSSDVSHELRTPLAVMQTKLEVFKFMNTFNESEVTSTTDVMLTQVEKLKKLIDDLLWFSKDTPLENKEKTDLYFIILDISKELESLANEKNIVIKIEETDFIVCGNDSLLERVVYNLLENAIKYSPKDSTIKVSFNHKKRTISFLDNGDTIQEKELIFEPFYRLDNSYSDNTGNGLGLAICKKILEKHDAIITVEENMPTGNIFKIAFPS